MKNNKDTASAGPNAQQLENLRTKLTSRLAEAHKNLDKFKEDLSTAPEYAMKWSVGAFTAAAEHKVFSLLLNAIDARTKNGESSAQIFRGITEFCQREVNTRARDNGSSTSPTDNLLNRELLGVWADALWLIDLGQ